MGGAEMRWRWREGCHGVDDDERDGAVLTTRGMAQSRRLAAGVERKAAMRGSGGGGDGVDDERANDDERGRWNGKGEMVEVGGKDAKAVHIPRTEIFLSRRVSVGFRQAPEITSS